MSHKGTPSLDIGLVTEQLQHATLQSAVHEEASPDNRRKHPQIRPSNDLEELSASPPSRRRLWLGSTPLQETHYNQSRGSSVLSDNGSVLGLGLLCDWTLPADLMGLVVFHLRLTDIKCCRLACKEWQRTVSTSLGMLRPRALHPHRMATRFPSLTALDLKRCKHVGDRELYHVTTLSTLCSLNLDGCEDVTDDSAPQLAALSRLTSLSLKNCVKISDVVLFTLCGSPEAAYRHATLSTSPRLLTSPRKIAPVSLPNGGGNSGQAASTSSQASSSSYTGYSNRMAFPADLAALDISGCIYITEHGMHALASTLTALTSLSIGGCSRVSTVSDAMLGAVGRCKELRVLDLSGCTNITGAGFSSLGRLTKLEQLCLWNCLRLSGESLSTLSAMKELRELSLRGCQQVIDEALVHLSGLVALQKLDLRACEHLQGTFVLFCMDTIQTTAL